MVRLSDDMFLFPLASFSKKMNFCSVLCRPVSTSFSLFSVLGDHGFKNMFLGKTGSEVAGMKITFCHF